MTGEAGRPGDPSPTLGAGSGGGSNTPAAPTLAPPSSGYVLWPSPPPLVAQPGREKPTGFTSCLAGSILLLVGGILTLGMIAGNYPFTTTYQLTLGLVAFLPGPLNLLAAGWLRASPRSRSRWGTATLALTVVELAAFAYVAVSGQVPLLPFVGGIWVVLGAIVSGRGALQARAWAVPATGGALPPISPFGLAPPLPPRASQGRGLDIVLTVLAVLFLALGVATMLGTVGSPHPRFVLACGSDWGGTGDTKNISLPAGTVRMNWTSNGPNLEVTVTNSTGGLVYDVTSDSSADAGYPSGMHVPGGEFTVGCIALSESGLGPAPELSVYGYT